MIEDREPVSLFAAITAAAIATVQALAYFLDWPDEAELIATAVVLAWIGVGAAWVRSKTTTRALLMDRAAATAEPAVYRVLTDTARLVFDDRIPTKRPVPR